MKEYKRANNSRVYMAFCQSPITIDKSKEWGEGNIQDHPNGAWIQIDDDKKISHLVANDPERNEPVGWSFSPSTYDDVNGRLKGFTKESVFAEQITNEDTVVVNTLDGEMTYDNTDLNGWLVCNKKRLEDLEIPDFSDSWFISNDEFVKLYKVDEED